MFKLEFKNNKIHRKEVSIYEFNKKKDYSIQFDKNTQQNQDKSKEAEEVLCINKMNKSHFGSI